MQPKQDVSSIGLPGQSGGANSVDGIFQSVIDNCPGAVLITDPNLCLIGGNLKGVQLLNGGYAPGRSVIESLSQEQAGRVRLAVEKAVESGAATNFDFLCPGFDAENTRFVSGWQVRRV